MCALIIKTAMQARPARASYCRSQLNKGLSFSSPDPSVSFGLVTVLHKRVAPGTRMRTREPGSCLLSCILGDPGVVSWGERKVETERKKKSASKSRRERKGSRARKSRKSCKRSFYLEYYIFTLVSIRTCIAGVRKIKIKVKLRK